MQLACDHDNAAGCNNLGIMYEQGQGLPKDAKRAARAYEKGCRGGSQGACRAHSALQQTGRAAPKQ